MASSSAAESGVCVCVFLATAAAARAEIGPPLRTDLVRVMPPFAAVPEAVDVDDRVGVPETVELALGVRRPVVGVAGVAGFLFGGAPDMLTRLAT